MITQKSYNPNFNPIKKVKRTRKHWALGKKITIMMKTKSMKNLKYISKLTRVPYKTIWKWKRATKKDTNYFIKKLQRKIKNKFD